MWKIFLYLMILGNLAFSNIVLAAKTENKADNFFGWEKSKYKGNVASNNKYNNLIIIGNAETINDVAAKFKVSKYKLAKYNHLKPPYRLFPGQKLYLPDFNDYYYVIKENDTLDKIAKLYDIDRNFLLRYNRLNPVDKLIVGSQIKIPEQFMVNNNEKLENNNQNQDNNYTIANNQISNKNKISIISANKQFIWPLAGKVIMPYGFKPGGIKNDGINIAAKSGTKVKSSAEGKVVYVGNKLKGYGNLVIIRHKNDWLTAYAHLDEIKINLNDEVKQGSIIATVGQTGNVSKPQLHFALRKKANAVNPELYLP